MVALRPAKGVAEIDVEFMSRLVSWPGVDIALVSGIGRAREQEARIALKRKGRVHPVVVRLGKA